MTPLFLELQRKWIYSLIYDGPIEVNASLCRDNTQLFQRGRSAIGSFLNWKFPRLLYITEERHWDLFCSEIPEAPLHHGGAPLSPPHYGGDLLGHTQREGPQQVLVRARSRPASAPVS